MSAKGILFLISTILMGAILTSACFAKDEKAKNPVVVMETSLGKIKIELFTDKAPKTVDNFLWYVNHKFYDNLIFHRVIPDFVIQGGGFTKEMKRKEPNAPITNEANNGLKNDRGTLSMARTNDINSATSQFFINLKDNPRLDHKNKTPGGFGYAVFGKVIEGIDVVDKIAAVPTKDLDSANKNVPKTPVVILKAYELKEKKK